MFGPRSAMLTLYGDYIRTKDGEIGIGCLIKVFSNFGLSEQSVRSAVSRMCRAGLLKVRRQGPKSYYSLTEAGSSMVSKGAKRIFERKASNWDGKWSIVVYFIPEEKRQARDHLRPELSWIGFGPLSEATWISPHSLLKEVEEVADRLNIKEYVQVFQATHNGLSDAKKLVSRCWDLNIIHQKYAEFIAKYKPKLEDHVKKLKNGKVIEPSDCFVERFNLVHEYRKLPYFDPDLPDELLPRNWLRSKAADLFQQYHDLLNEDATKYFKSVIKEY
jgi:phenylacetic acid degradation operon negative regulatory protein